MQLQYFQQIINNLLNYEYFTGNEHLATIDTSLYFPDKIVRNGRTIALCILDSRRSCDDIIKSIKNSFFAIICTKTYFSTLNSLSHKTLTALSPYACMIK